MKGVKNGGDPTPAIDRLMSKVTKMENGCWIFSGAKQKRGHGLIKVGSATDGTQKAVKVHRLAYEHFKGAIPEGLSLDHLCRTASCVNPDHLEPVTRGENVRREADRRTECRHGHAWTEENITVISGGVKTCSICLKKTTERRNAKRREQRKNINL